MPPADRDRDRDRDHGRARTPHAALPLDGAGPRPGELEGPAGPAGEDLGVALANGPGAPAGIGREPGTPGLRQDSQPVADVAAARSSSFGDHELGRDASSAEDGTSADLLLADDAPTVGGTLLGRARDPHDHGEWHETPGGTLLAPGDGG